MGKHKRKKKNYKDRLIRKKFNIMFSNEIIKVKPETVYSTIPLIPTIYVTIKLTGFTQFITIGHNRYHTDASNRVTIPISISKINRFLRTNKKFNNDQKISIHKYLYSDNSETLEMAISMIKKIFLSYNKKRKKN